MTREWYIGQALESVQGLNRVLSDLTAEEVIACLELESASLRRRSIIDRLIGRAVRLNELEYAASLKNRFL